MDLQENKKVSDGRNDDKGIFILSIIGCIYMFFFNIDSIFSDSPAFYVFEKLFNLENDALGFLLIFSPVILVSCIIIYKYSSKKSKIKSYLIYFSPFIYVIIMMLIFSITNTYLSHFDSNKWLKYEEARYLMVENLTSKYKLKEMNETDVLKLLGKPRYEDPATNTKQYYIHGYIDDADYLIIKFDKNNKVIDYEVQNINF